MAPTRLELPSTTNSEIWAHDVTYYLLLCAKLDFLSFFSHFSNLLEDQLGAGLPMCSTEQ